MPFLPRQRRQNLIENLLIEIKVQNSSQCESAVARARAGRDPQGRMRCKLLRQIPLDASNKKRD